MRFNGHDAWIQQFWERRSLMDQNDWTKHESHIKSNTLLVLGGECFGLTCRGSQTRSTSFLAMERMRRVERREHVEPRPQRSDCQNEIPWMRGSFTILLVKLYYDHLISPGIHQDVVFYKSGWSCQSAVLFRRHVNQKYPEITKSFSILAVTPNHSPWKGFFDILRAELRSPLRNTSTAVVRGCSKRLKRKAMCLEVAAHEGYHSGAKHSQSHSHHSHLTFCRCSACMKHSACAREGRPAAPGTPKPLCPALEAPRKASQRHVATARKRNAPIPMIPTGSSSNVSLFPVPSVLGCDVGASTHSSVRNPKSTKFF